MDYRSFGGTYVVRMDPGEEILASLTALCEKEDIRLASVEAIGAANRAELCVYDVQNKVFHEQTLTGPMEIASLAGSVTRRDGQVYLHLHGVVCDENLAAHGGHVKSLTVSATCEMFVRTLPGKVGRRTDEATGLNVFDF